MTTETITLSSFLLARIAEDEAVAREAQSTGDGWRYDGDGEVWSHMQLVSHPTMVGHAAHIARHDPARVLAECAAKRAIVERHQPAADGAHYGSLTGFACGTCTDFHADMECEGEQWPCLTVRALASIYSDHPDYREEWLP